MMHLFKDCLQKRCDFLQYIKSLNPKFFMSLRDIFVKNYCQLRILVILIAKLFYEFIQQLVLAASSKCFYYDFSFRFDNCNTKCLQIAE